MTEDILTPESVETPTTPPVDEETPDNEITELDDKEKPSTPPVKSKSEDELAWDSLKGNTQERIRELIHERDEWKSKAARKAQEDLDYLNKSTPTPTPSDDDEVGRAIRQLNQRGIPTRDEMKAELTNIVTRLETDRNHDRLETKFDGRNGLPKYDRVVVEDYARKKGIYNLESAFRDMYFDEFVDYAKKQKPSPSTIPGERPSASQPKETTTLESLRQQLRGPNARKVYEKLAKDPAKLDALLRQLTSEE